MSSQHNSSTSCGASHQIQAPRGLTVDAPGRSDEQGTKKRKRDGCSMEDLLKDAFSVKPYPPAGTGNPRPRTLQPLVLLPRSHLPLSFLDFASTKTSLLKSRLFESHVKILELEERMGSQPMILIARLDDDRTMYAVEREDRGLYVVCKLGSWINLRQLKAAAVVFRHDTATTATANILSTTMAPTTTPGARAHDKMKRVEIEALQHKVKRPATEPPPNVQPTEAKVDAALPAVSNVVETSGPSLAVQLTSAEIFDNIRNQYFETLYLSKTSLAYFAKGPLSRARTAFNLDFDATLDMKDLVVFLQSLVITSSLMEKKYKNGVPECIASIDLHDHSDPDTAIPKAKKRKSTKAMKLGRNGLYPMEDGLIRKWWASHDEEVESGAHNSREGLANTRRSQLRIREIQLQIIVILEILALRPLVAVPEATGNLPGLPTPTTVVPTIEKKSNKAPKSKKSEDVGTTLDTNVERLTIWQTVSSDTVQVSNDDPAQKTLAPKQSDSTLTLKEFCVEVLGPFYSGRLPMECDSIQRKFFPLAATPTKPRMPKAASFSNEIARPGAATKRLVPAKSNSAQVLQRFVNERRESRPRSMSRPVSRAGSLMRSISGPTMPTFKREPSDVPLLTGVPPADSQVRVNVGSAFNSKRFSQREVDTSLYRRPQEASSKAERKALIDAEIKDAITAIKRPNRELARKSLSETAEKRTGPTPRSRKLKKPVQNPLFQKVQIGATPKANRQKDVFSQNPGSQRPDMIHEPEMPVPPSSQLVPQSANRQQEPKKAMFSMVEATPTRRSLPGTYQQVSDQVDYDGPPPSSPMQARRPTSIGLDFERIPGSIVKAPASRTLSEGLLETPMRKRTQDHAHPTAYTAPGHNKENSGMNAFGMEDWAEPRSKAEGRGHASAFGMGSIDLYKSLGWDDTDEMDDLA